MQCHAFVVAEQMWSESDTEMSETERPSPTLLALFRVSVTRVVYM
jgi:hypothetical protein